MLSGNWPVSFSETWHYLLWNSAWEVVWTHSEGKAFRWKLLVGEEGENGIRIISTPPPHFLSRGMNLGDLKITYLVVCVCVPCSVCVCLWHGVGLSPSTTWKCHGTERL